MLKLSLFIIGLLMSSRGRAQIKGVPGTLNQIQNDPAQSEFEEDYGKLRKSVWDLDRPKPHPSPKKKKVHSRH